MSTSRFNPSGVLIIAIIAVVSCLRLLFSTHTDFSAIAQFSPVGAMAMFGGAFFNRTWKALLFPIGMLFLSDIIMQQTVHSGYTTGFMYAGWAWVYVAFLLMVVAARLIMKNITPGRFLISVLAVVLIHWIVADIGTWLESGLYAKNPAGFIECLTLAIPFELRFLAGTFGYGVVLFGGFALIRQRYPSLQRAV